ncbi:Smad nuclear interacting protein 1 [Pseudolycoriella hygida]|uniref:Smad nuclear interacting protein 1 n=1 Tax=Pseudolycoriella hygida TaxID=35572 RepID=A0A9Q0RTZ5_9DIPT|nr:Smad nuclear interacting protein 1 [Pseudolycoriella hygida]
MSKTKKSRKQEESSDDSDNSSTSEDSSSDSSSEERSHTKKHKKKSRKVKKRKLKKKSVQDDSDSKEDVKQSKRSKKSGKHKKKHKHQDSDSDVEVQEHSKVLYISSGGEDDREKHYQRSKRLGELKTLRGIDEERNVKSKWDSPAEDREKQRSGNYSTSKYGRDNYSSRDDEPQPDRYNRRHDNNSFEFRRNFRYEGDRGYRQMEPGRRYENDQRRYDRNFEPRRHSAEMMDTHVGRDHRFDGNHRNREAGHNRPEFSNRSFNDRHGERRRDFDDKRRDERMESDPSGRRDGGGRITRNPFDRTTGGNQLDELKREDVRREDLSRRDEPRRDEYRRDEPRRDEYRREERGRINDHRYTDRNAERVFKRERENSGGNRFEDNRNKRSRSLDHQRTDKRDSKRDYDRNNYQHRKGSHERRRHRSSSQSPVQQKNRRFRGSHDDSGNHEWGKKSSNSNDNSKAPVEKEKPNFGLSGKLTEDANKVNGVVINYAEPPEARKPKRRWRLYPFKGEQSLQTFYIHRQSCFLIGRDRKICDIPVDHPSCSKQHAVLQYRLVPYEKEDGTTSKRVRPYILDMSSANGTFVNNKKIDPKKYVELLEKDVIKFGYSSREYVLLHENSKDDSLDDDIGNDDVYIKTEGE